MTRGCFFFGQIQSDKGNVMVYSLIAIAIVAVVVMQMATRQTAMLKTESISNARQSQDSIFNEELNYIMNKDACSISKIKSNRVLSPVGGVFPSPNVIFEVSSSSGEGLSYESLTLTEKSLFYDLVIDSIFIGPFSHKYDSLMMDPSSAEALNSKKIERTNNLEYVPLANDEYLAMLYIKNHPRSESASGLFLSSIPIIIKYNNGVVSCRSANGKNVLASNCSSMGGFWNEQAFRCELKVAPDVQGNIDVCPIDNSCNAAPQYQL